jgi:hypothetical protein
MKKQTVMYKNNYEYHPSFQAWSHPYSKSGNSLGIGNITFNWDHAKKQLILNVETRRKMSSDIKAVLKGNRLTFEAPLVYNYNKPLRTHLIGSETREEFEDGFTVVAQSQIRLKHGYHYHLISCQVHDPNRIQAVLGFTKWVGNEVNYV